METPPVETQIDLQIEELIRANLAPTSSAEENQVRSLILLAKRSSGPVLDRLLEISTSNADLERFTYRFRNTRKLL